MNRATAEALDANIQILQEELCCLKKELNSSIITEVVEDYDELLTVTPVENTFYYVKNEQGTYWLPGGFGGTYYPSGIYFWDGTEWLNDNISIALELNDLNIDLDALETTVDNHVTDFNNPHMTPIGGGGGDLIADGLVDDTYDTYYIGFTRNSAWEILKSPEDDPNNTSIATVVNNPSYTTLSNAWAARATITYT